MFCVDWERIMARLEDAEQRAQKLIRSDEMVKQKVGQYRFPMQELQLQSSQTKGKMYTEEEDRYLLCRLAHYGLHSDDVYDKIKKDISDFPVFRFDWFLRSRTPVELGRRCATLISLIAKEFDASIEDEEEEEVEEQPKPKPAAARGRVGVSVSFPFLITHGVMNRNVFWRSSLRIHGRPLPAQQQLQGNALRRRKELEMSS